MSKEYNRQIRLKKAADLGGGKIKKKKIEEARKVYSESAAEGYKVAGETREQIKRMRLKKVPRDIKVNLQKLEAQSLKKSQEASGLTKTLKEYGKKPKKLKIKSLKYGPRS